MIDYDETLNLMKRLDRRGFEAFNNAFRNVILDWCRDVGFGESRARRETERCLFELSIMAVLRADEIQPGRLKQWVLTQTRNLVVLYWQMDDDAREGESLVVTGKSVKPRARSVRQWTLRLDGSVRAYGQAARVLGLPLGWLRRQHRRMLKRLQQIQSSGDQRCAPYSELVWGGSTSI